jgi:hypothetical protein
MGVNDTYKFGEGKLNTKFRDRRNREAETLVKDEPACICRKDEEGHLWMNMGCHVHGEMSHARHY